jgi:hypothetical protein
LLSRNQAKDSGFLKQHTKYAAYKVWAASGGLDKFKKSTDYAYMSKAELCFQMLEIVPGLREAIRAERAVRNAGCTGMIAADVMALVRELECDSSSDDESGAEDKIANLKTQN